MTKLSGTRRTGRRLWALPVVPLAVLLSVGVASAYWTAKTAPGSNGATGTASVNAGMTPSPTLVGGNSVKLTWAATMMTTGGTVGGYAIKRYDANTGVQQTITSACDGNIAALTCTENNVPNGSWKYTVTPQMGMYWTGQESAKSATINVDNVAPVNNLSLNVISGNAFLSGTTVYYRGSAAGSFQVVNALTDVGTGPKSSATAALGGPSTGWTHTASTVSSPAGGPYTSNAFSWTANTTTSPTEVVTGADNAGNPTTTMLTFVNNSGGPTGGAVTVNGLTGTVFVYSTSKTLNLTLNMGTDPVGFAAGVKLQRATATLTSSSGADGVCGTFGAYTTIATDPATPYNDTVTDQACYQYQYVVTDNFGNTVTYTSSQVKVDTTAPSAPTFAFTSGSNSYGNGSSVYYRPGVAGSFTATAAATDAASGITAYTLPALGTGWSGGGTVSSGATTYSWTSTAGAPGAKSATATNNAGLVSTAGTFTTTADSTSPSGGSISYPNGAQYSTSVSVTFTNGSDTGSGIGTRTLQRASAPFTSSGCGSWTGFTTVAGGTNPSSPFTDTVSRGTCYKYQYIVADNVGNTASALTSANVVQVKSGYYDAIMATAGLTNYWRLGESLLASDSFRDTSGTMLTKHTDDSGSTWTRNTTVSDTNAIIDSSGVHKNGASQRALLYSSAVPASADYAVSAKVHVSSNLTNDAIGVIGRYDTGAANATYYAAYYEQSSSTWVIAKVVDGSGVTPIARSGNSPLSKGSSHQLTLDMKGNLLRLIVDGDQVASINDGSITGAGRGGLIFGNGSNTTTDTASAGYQITSFQINPPMADSEPVNPTAGSYLDGIALGATGAIAGDSDTAATFDGIDDYASVSDSVTNDFTIEFWFKSTQGIGTDTTWQSGAGLVDANISGANRDFGISLRSDGKLIAGDGNGNQDYNLVSTTGGYDDGKWHYVAYTRSATSGAMTIYVDGVQSGTTTGATGGMNSTSMTFGRLSGANTSGDVNFFAGSLDEVAIYNVALSSSTVSDHYHAGIGS